MLTILALDWHRLKCERSTILPKTNCWKTADSDTVSTYQVSLVQLVTDKKLEAFNKA